MLETYTFGDSAMVQTIRVLNRSGAGNVTTSRVFDRKTGDQLRREEEEKER